MNIRMMMGAVRTVREVPVHDSSVGMGNGIVVAIEFWVVVAFVVWLVWSV